RLGIKARLRNSSRARLRRTVRQRPEGDATPETVKLVIQRGLLIREKRSIPMKRISRRSALKIGLGLGAAAVVGRGTPQARAAKRDPKWQAAVEKGLKWVAETQSSLGHWTAANYPTAMTALAGTALIASGSTATQGP